MPRPTILVAEPEPEQALSVRKLVLETAKFNVLTAHSDREALDIFHLFPNVSVAVLVGDHGINCEVVATHIRSATHKVPIIFITSRIAAKSSFADHTLANGEPETLLGLVRTLVGDPREM
jgi:DNA-binding response OmpR family regulator